MTAAVARALMVLATCCMGQTRREWALAMQAEFDAAGEAGRPLPFAIGCLIAACRELPRHAEGRLGIASHVIALGLVVPLATLQFLCGFEWAIVPGGLDLAPNLSAAPFLASTQNAGLPILHMLWFLLGAWHLHLAWVLLERDWERVVQAGSLIAAATLTLFTFMAVLLLGTTALMAVVAVLAIETVFILALARWDALLFPYSEPAAYSW